MFINQISGRIFDFYSKILRTDARLSKLNEFVLHQRRIDRNVSADLDTILFDHVIGIVGMGYAKLDMAIAVSGSAGCRCAYVATNGDVFYRRSTSRGWAPLTVAELRTDACLSKLDEFVLHHRRIDRNVSADLDPILFDHVIRVVVGNTKLDMAIAVPGSTGYRCACAAASRYVSYGRSRLRKDAHA